MSNNSSRYLLCGLGAILIGSWIVASAATSYAWWHGVVQLRPAAVILSTDTLAVSFELTNNPACSTLMRGCPPSPSSSGRYYLTSWRFFTMPYSVIGRKLLTIPLTP